MSWLFEMNTPFLATFLVLVSMSVLSLVLFVFFYRKYRCVALIPKNLDANVFDKTFNVFNPFAEHKKTIQNITFPIIVFAMGGTLLVSIIFTAVVLQFGLLLALMMLIVCLNLTVMDEAFEIFNNAKIFLKAVENKTGLAIGDLKVLFLVRKALPKISLYYLLLSVVFIASSLMLPQIMSSLTMAFAQLVGGTMQSAAPFGPIAYYLTPFVVVILTFVFQIITNKIKGRVFEVSSSDFFDKLESKFRNYKSFASWVSHHEGIAGANPMPEPEDMPESEKDKT